MRASWLAALLVSSLLAALPSRPVHGAPDADPDVTRAGRAALAEVCRALEGGDEASIRRHVRIPLPVRLIVRENAGNPITRSRFLRSPREIRDARLCRHLARDGTRVTTTKNGWLLVADIGQFDARLELARTPKGPQLISYRQPAR